MTRKYRVRRRISQSAFSSFESLERRVALTASPVELDAPMEAVQTVSDGPQVARIVNGTQTSDYEAVGFVNGQCTGTLISPKHVLTAAHCIEGGRGFLGNTQGSFEAEGQSFGTVKMIVHPDYDTNDFGAGNDIAVMELDRPATNIDPMEILRQTPQVGQMLTLVGFGEGGTSTGGFDPQDDGKQVGRTELEEVTNHHLIWNFDSHSEANTAPGDSGGPAFVTLAGQQFIAGVTSGGDGDAHSLGDRSFDTRVDVHASWIDSIVSGQNTDPGTGGGDSPGDGIGDGDFGDDPGFDDGFDEGPIFGELDAEELAAEELELYDEDGNGALSVDELANEFMDFGDSVDDAYYFAEDLVASFDADGNGELSYDELVTSYSDDFVDDGLFDDGDFDDDDFFDDIFDGGDFGDDLDDDDVVAGDITGDGVFDSADLIAIFDSGHFEDGIDDNSTLAEGDVNGDGDVDTADLIYLFQNAIYADGPAGNLDDSIDDPIFDMGEDEGFINVGGEWDDVDWDDAGWIDDGWTGDDWGDDTWDTGDWDTGDWDTGDWDTGDWDTGDWDTGDWDTGDWDTGEWDAGEWANDGWDDSWLVDDGWGDDNWEGDNLGEVDDFWADDETDWWSEAFALNG